MGIIDDILSQRPLQTRISGLTGAGASGGTGAPLQKALDTVQGVTSNIRTNLNNAIENARATAQSLRGTVQGFQVGQAVRQFRQQALTQSLPITRRIRERGTVLPRTRSVQQSSFEEYGSVRQTRFDKFRSVI